MLLRVRVVIPEGIRSQKPNDELTNHLSFQPGDIHAGRVNTHPNGWMCLHIPFLLFPFLWFLPIRYSMLIRLLLRKIKGSFLATVKTKTLCPRVITGLSYRISLELRATLLTLYSPIIGQCTLFKAWTENLRFFRKQSKRTGTR